MHLLLALGGKCNRFTLRCIVLDCAVFELYLRCAVFELYLRCAVFELYLFALCCIWTVFVCTVLYLNCICLHCAVFALCCIWTVFAMCYASLYLDFAGRGNLKSELREIICEPPPRLWQLEICSTFTFKIIFHSFFCFSLEIYIKKFHSFFLTVGDLLNFYLQNYFSLIFLFLSGNLFPLFPMKTKCWCKFASTAFGLKVDLCHGSVWGEQHKKRRTTHAAAQLRAIQHLNFNLPWNQILMKRKLN